MSARTDPTSHSASSSSSSTTLIEEPAKKRRRTGRSSSFHASSDTPCPRLDKLVQTVSLKAILLEITKGAVVLLDIDNNVAKTQQQLASDQWFRWRISQGKKAGESFEAALDDWTMLMFKTKMEPAEPEVAATVKEIQRRATTIAVTSRGMRLGTRTVTQLEEIGVDFTKSAPTQQEIFWPRGFNGNAEHVLYEKGILFSAGQNKGLAMKKLFAKLSMKPSKVIFADDSLAHVEHVRQACTELDIPFVGFHNIGLQDWVKELDPKLTALQYAGFARIPSDEEVQEAI